jgi:aspartate/methionine/tyrosine aminotransferase
MTRLGATFAQAPRSAVREMLERALARPGTVHLELGDPDFATPAHVVEAANRAAAEGFTHYTPSAGLPSLRELIAARVRAAAEQVVVTTGAAGGLFALLRVLLDSGNELLVPDPGWTGYAAIAGALGAKVRSYALDRSRRFALDPAAVEAALTPATRVIALNSPGNPAGAVADRDALRSVIELAARHDLWVVSDEAYEAFVFEGTHTSAAAAADGPVISVFTCSKTYAMTGWRVGWVVAPPEVARLVARAQEATVTCVSTVSQKAAEAALGGPQECVDEMRAAYESRLERATKLLDEAGVGYVRPQGGLYLLVDVAPSGRSSRDFALSLLDEHGVAVVPGSAFGPGAEGLGRVSLGVAQDRLDEGLARLAAAVKEERVGASAP